MREARGTIQVGSAPVARSDGADPGGERAGCARREGRSRRGAQPLREARGAIRAGKQVDAPGEGGQAAGMRVGPVMFLLAGWMAACGGGSSVTAIQCRAPEWCEEQTPLCHNSCDHKGAEAGCNDCCNEMRRKCLDCAPKEEIHFGTCPRRLRPRN